MIEEEDCDQESKGRVTLPNWMNFREKIQTAFVPLRVLLANCTQLSATSETWSYLVFHPLPFVVAGPNPDIHSILL